MSVEANATKKQKERIVLLWILDTEFFKHPVYPGHNWLITVLAESLWPTSAVMLSTLVSSSVSEFLVQFCNVANECIFVKWNEFITSSSPTHNFDPLGATYKDHLMNNSCQRIEVGFYIYWRVYIGTWKMYYLGWKVERSAKLTEESLFFLSMILDMRNSLYLKQSSGVESFVNVKFEG